METKLPHRAAQRIRQFRKRRGWSQASFAGWLGVSRIGVAKWELGLCRPRMDMAERLAKEGVCDPGDWIAPPLEKETVCDVCQLAASQVDACMNKECPARALAAA